MWWQLKEALQAVLAPHAGKSEFEHQGQRVVVGQRLMQAASDMFLGWTSYRGHDYYVRQYRDMKRSVNLDAMTPAGFASYAEVCGRTLARAHARSGDAAAISGYLGSGTVQPRGRRVDRATPTSCAGGWTPAAAAAGCKAGTATTPASSSPAPGRRPWCRRLCVRLVDGARTGRRAGSGADCG